MPGTYPRRMVKQGAEAIECVRVFWNHDVAAAVMHLRGFDITPSALRRLWLGTARRPGTAPKPGLLARVAELAAEPDPDVIAKAMDSRNPVMLQLARILGSRDRARQLVEYLLDLLSDEEVGVEDAPHPVVALPLGVDPWEPPDADYSVEPWEPPDAGYSADDHREDPVDDHPKDPPESVIRRMKSVRDVWRRLRKCIQEAGKADWTEARDIVRRELELVSIIAQLRELFPRHTETIKLNDRELLLSLVPSEGMAIALVPTALTIDDKRGRLDGLAQELTEARAVLRLAKALPARMRESFDAALAVAEQTGWFKFDDDQAEWLNRFAERRPEVVAALQG